MDRNIIRIREQRLMILAALCAALTVVVFLVAVDTIAGQRAGNAAIAGGLARQGAILREAARALNLISLTTLAAATLVIMGIGFVRGGWRLAAVAGGAILGANVLTQLLKRYVLQRPALMDVQDPFGSHNSFPSGHATIGMSLVLGLLIVLPAAGDLWIAIMGWFYLVATGIAMIAEGWHRPSDAVGGYLVATLAACVASAVALWLTRQHIGALPIAIPARDHLWRASRSLAPAGLALAVAAAAALLGISGGRGWDALDDNTFGWSFVFGAVYVSAVSASMIALFLRALAGADLAARSWTHDNGDRAEAQVSDAPSRRTRS